MGFIKFGSRVDVLLQPGTKIDVSLNQVVQGGVTWVLVAGQLTREPYALDVQRRLSGVLDPAIERLRAQDPGMEVLRLGAVFFAKATIRELASHLAGTPSSTLQPIARAEERNLYPLSSEQSRLFLLQNMCPESTGYNLPEVYRVDGTLDLERLQNTFEKLIQRHESLRTSFELQNGIPAQRIHASAHFEIEVHEASEELAAEIIARFIKPFSLGEVPLLRVSVVRSGARYLYFMLDWHHVITDGFSRDVLLRDFLEIYAGGCPPQPQVQYRDYLDWQIQSRHSEWMLRQKQFWCAMLETPGKPLLLPADYPRPQVRSLIGQTLEFDISSEILLKLKTLARLENASLFMTLFASASAFLGRLCAQEDVVVGTPIAGRDHPDLESAVGMFVNTFAVRSYPAVAKTFRQYLHEVRDTFLEAVENQNYQFDQLVEALRTKREGGRNPLFDVMFVLQDTETQPFVIPGARLIPHEYERTSSKMDLTIHMREQRGVLTCSFEYDTSLFRRTTIELMRDRFLVFLDSLVSDPACLIGRLQLRTKEERSLQRFGEETFEFS